MYYSCVGVDPYAYPQHNKVLEHCSYIQYQYGCGMHSLRGCCSLSTITINDKKVSSGLSPHLHKSWYSVRVHHHMPIHSISIYLLKNFVDIQYGLGCSLRGCLQPQP
jgi:hypothetical protein